MISNNYANNFHCSSFYREKNINACTLKKILMHGQRCGILFKLYGKG